MVLYADDESFTFMTPEGHTLSAWITFSAHRDGDGRPSPRRRPSSARPTRSTSSPTCSAANRLNDRFWRQTLENLARHVGRRRPRWSSPGRVHRQATPVASRRQRPQQRDAADRPPHPDRTGPLDRPARVMPRRPAVPGSERDRRRRADGASGRRGRSARRGRGLARLARHRPDGVDRRLRIGWRLPDRPATADQHRLAPRAHRGELHRTDRPDRRSGRGAAARGRRGGSRPSASGSGRCRARGRSSATRSWASSSRPAPCPTVARGDRSSSSSPRRGSSPDYR